MITHHSVTFGGQRRCSIKDHWRCGSGDIKNLAFHVISQDHVIKDNVVLVCRVILQEHVVKGSCDFIGRSSSR